jgi:hypothetical protein
MTEQDPYLSLCERFPHCDAFVLHSPGSCEYCDMPEFAVLHQYRRDNNINHTGEQLTTKKECPAEARRALATINRWYGNRSEKPST